MKYEVTYFVVDRNDNNYEKTDIIEANSRQEIHRQLRKLNRGCHVHDISAKELADEIEAPIEDRVCPQCKAPLNDMNECPVCDHGDEEARPSHTIYAKESVNRALREAKEDAIRAQAIKDKKSGVTLDPLNPDDMENVSDEYGYDDEETEIYKKHYFEESAKETSVETFWKLVCSGKDDEVFKICTDNRDPKKNYNRFGSDHSYIMGAIRNGNYSTAKLLLTFGHKILEHESYEVVSELLKAKGVK